MTKVVSASAIILHRRVGVWYDVVKFDWFLPRLVWVISLVCLSLFSLSLILFALRFEFIKFFLVCMVKLTWFGWLYSSAFYSLNYR